MIRSLLGFLEYRGVTFRRARFNDNPHIDLLDVLLQREASHGKRLCIIQIGANDGRTHDPLYASIQKYNPRAVRVEPLPEPFAQLRKLHENAPDILCINAAFAAKDGEAILYRLQTETPCEHASLVASFDRALVARHAKLFKEARPTVVPVRVPSLSPCTIAARAGFDHVDLLQVDAEGFDDEVIRLTLAAGLRPAIISFESLFLSPARKRSIRSLLEVEGYRFANVHFDTICYRT